MKIDKSLSLSHVCMIDGESVAFFNGNITLNDELDYQINNGINNQKLYRANREAVNDAYMEFEDEVYKIVDKIQEGGSDII